MIVPTLYRSPIELRANSNATIHLASGTINYLECQGTSTTSKVPQAGIYVAPAKPTSTPSGGVAVPSEELGVAASVTIKGTGTLTAINGNYSACIGGAANESSGHIKIVDATIIANTRAISGQATNTANGAGIGGGGAASWVNLATEETPIIEITGGAKVTASSAGHGAGIGSGGAQSSSTNDNGIIIISGNAWVTATSAKNGAGIGGGGLETLGTMSGPSNPTTKVAGSGGTITITGNAQVDATSKGSGAGIGGGGKQGYSSGIDGMAGASGTILIDGTAKVTAVGTTTVNNKGTGIGGGGIAIADVNISLDNHGGSITIQGDPIVVAQGMRDMGAGTDGVATGTAVDILIKAGNIDARHEKSDEAKNEADDILGRVMISNVGTDFDPYTVLSRKTSATYEYKARRNDEDKTHLWVPLGVQVVVDREYYLKDALEVRATIDATVENPFTVPGNKTYIIDEGLELVGGERDVSWTAGVSLPAMDYLYKGKGPIVDILDEDGVTWKQYQVGKEAIALLDGTPGDMLADAVIADDEVIDEGGVYIVEGAHIGVQERVDVTTTDPVILVANNTVWRNPGNGTSITTILGENSGPLVARRDTKVQLVVLEDTINEFTSTSLGQSATSWNAGIYVSSGVTGASSAGNPAELLITGGQIISEEDMEEIEDGTRDGGAGYANTGRLRAASRQYGAGIGGGTNERAGSIAIVAGIITAEAGIGGGATPIISSADTLAGAGIGGGGGASNGGGVAAEIKIGGMAEVTAIAYGYGAGIGGAGGGMANNASSQTPGGAGDGGNITIKQWASVTAISHFDGAGIGGGARSRNNAGSNPEGHGGDGGNIWITDEATVSATSNGLGAGIGGGGSRNANAPAGEGGNIVIDKNAQVTVYSSNQGAGIGGGGHTTGNASEGGSIKLSGETKINIASNAGAAIGGGSATVGVAGETGAVEIFSEDPTDPGEKSTIIVAQSANGQYDIGPGGDGTGGTVTIDSGNVYAGRDKVYEPKNTVDDGLIRADILAQDAETVVYKTSGASAGLYDYKATYNDDKESYLWVPPAEIEVSKKLRGAFANLLLEFDFEIAVLSTEFDAQGDPVPYPVNLVVFDVLDSSGDVIEKDKELKLDEHGKATLPITKHGDRINLKLPIVDGSDVEDDSDGNGTIRYTIKENDIPESYELWVSRDNEPVEEITNSGEVTRDVGDASTKKNKYIASEDFFNIKADIVPSAVDIANSSFFGPAIAILELMILAALLVRYRKIKQQRLTRLVKLVKH